MQSLLFNLFLSQDLEMRNFETINISTIEIITTDREKDVSRRDKLTDLFCRTWNFFICNWTSHDHGIQNLLD